MIIAAVINEAEIILPIVEGTILRIYNTETKEQKDFPNPALGLTEGRRGATLRFAESNGANVFVAPPNTFCQLSYEAAQKDQVEFFHIAENTSYLQFEYALRNGEIAVQTSLPVEEIVPSQPISK